MDFTLYVDESGQFSKSSSQPQSLGLRVVGGVMVAGKPGDHDQLARDSFARRMGWYEAPYHAADLAPSALVRRVCKRPLLLPLDLQRHVEVLRRPLNVVQQEHRETWKAIRQASLNLQGRLLDAVRDFVDESKAQVLVVAEENQSRTRSRYPAMLSALVWYALERLGATDSAALLHVISEHRHDVPDELRVPSPGRPTARLERWDTVTKNSSYAVDMADAVTWAVGPRKNDLMDWNESMRRAGRTTSHASKDCGCSTRRMRWEGWWSAGTSAPSSSRWNRSSSSGSPPRRGAA